MSSCTTCGRPRIGTNRFCTVCGAEFQDPAQPGQPATAADPAPTEDYYAPGGVVPGLPSSQRASHARPPETEPSYPGEVYSGPAHDERYGGEPVYRGKPAFGGPGYTDRDSYPEPARRPPALVNSYFTAINQHDYSAYASLLDQQAQRQNPESTFDSGYATTTDSAETLTSISGTGSGGLAASLTFTSQQSPADSPDSSSCDQWSITLFLVPNGAGYLIGTPPSSYSASYQAC